MQINPTVKARTVTQGSMLITNKSSLPDGSFVYSGPLIGKPGHATVFIIDRADRTLNTIIPPPKTVFEIDNRQGTSSPPQARPQTVETEQTSTLFTPERVGIAQKNILDEVKKGAAGIVLTHAVQKGGAAVATPLVTNALGLSGDPAATAAIGNIITGSEVAKNAQILGNLFKLLIFAGSCFGISLTVLKLFFNDNVPRWAWITSILVNVALTVVVALYLFDVGPFAPPR